MPRVSMERAAELVGDTGSFGHGHLSIFYLYMNVRYSGIL
jgi:hypothetical protein